MKRIWVPLLGVAIGIALTVPMTALAANQDEKDATDTHSTVHAMMDAMHSEGSSEQMHEAMPGSEAIMDDCASMMETMESTDGMMPDGGMMNGMGGMMNMMRGLGSR